MPAPVGLEHVQLQEGTGQFLFFPRRGRLARLEAHYDVLHPHRLVRVKLEVADDAVALVEQAQHGDALGHRRYARLLGGGARHFDGDGIAFGRLFVAAVAAGERGKRGKRGKGQRRFSHFWSGVQAL